MLEEAGEAPEDVEGSDDEGGRKKNQFKSHLKTNEAVWSSSSILSLDPLFWRS